MGGRGWCVPARIIYAGRLVLEKSENPQGVNPTYDNAQRLKKGQHRDGDAGGDESVLRTPANTTDVLRGYRHSSWPRLPPQATLVTAKLAAKPFREVKQPRCGLEACRARRMRARRAAPALSTSVRNLRQLGTEMEFGIFSNGFRPHTTAAQTYEEDLAEIVLADQLGFRVRLHQRAPRRAGLYRQGRHAPGPGTFDVQGGGADQANSHGRGGQAHSPRPSGRYRHPDRGDRSRGRRQPFHLRFRLRLSQSAVRRRARAVARRPPRAACGNRSI